MFVCMCLYFLLWESLIKIISIFRNYKFLFFIEHCKLKATGWVATIFVVCFTSMYSVCVFWAYSLGYEAKLVHKN